MMGNQFQKKPYTFKIDNFSQRNTLINSPLFSIGSCNWYVTVYPMGSSTSRYMGVYLAVPDPISRPHNWSRSARFRFVIVNPSSVLKSKSFENYHHLFNKQKPIRGFKIDLRHSKLQEEGFLVNDTLKIEVYINVSIIQGGLDPLELPEKKNETVNVNGFQVLPSQVKSAKLIFETYPETALHIFPQDPLLKTAYMNILLRIYETLHNSSVENLTETELINLSNSLSDLTQAGFKLEWLRKKLEKVSLERKKLSDYEAQAQKLEKELEILELVMRRLKAGSN